MTGGAAISQPHISFWARSTSDSFRVSREHSSSHSFGAQALSRQKLGPSVQAQSQNVKAQVEKVTEANSSRKIKCFTHKHLTQIPLTMEAQPWSEMLTFWELHLQRQRDAGSKEER